MKGAKAKLYIDNAKQPNLIVNDLKMGADASGFVGLFVDIGTEGYFRNLKIYPAQYFEVSYKKKKERYLNCSCFFMYN